MTNCWAWRLSGYRHSRPIRVQLEHAGRDSWHLTFLRLQLKQPRRDFVWPFRGTGRRRILTLSSVADPDGVTDIEAGSESAELLGSVSGKFMVRVLPALVCEKLKQRYSRSITKETAREVIWSN